MLVIAPVQDIPRIDIPLHTLIELTPRPDGTMAEERFFVDVDAAMKDVAAGEKTGTDDSSSAFFASS